MSIAISSIAELNLTVTDDFISRMLYLHRRCHCPKTQIQMSGTNLDPLSVEN